QRDLSTVGKEMSERSGGPHHPPMLERYLREEDRLRKFLARPKEHRTQQKETSEGKQLTLKKRSKMSGQVNEGCEVKGSEWRTPTYHATTTLDCWELQEGFASVWGVS
ncbi:MAG: hypothetical protein Q9173_004838, partial [Seirophora scorigena]